MLQNDHGWIYTLLQELERSQWALDNFLQNNRNKVSMLENSAKIILSSRKKVSMLQNSCHKVAIVDNKCNDGSMIKIST
jgi:hypothetical protein